MVKDLEHTDIEEAIDRIKKKISISRKIIIFLSLIVILVTILIIAVNI